MNPRTSPFPAAVLASLALLVAALLGYASSFEYASLRATADRYSGSGEAAFFTPEFHAGMVLRLRIMAGLFVLGALVALARRGPIGRLWARMRASASSLCGDARAALRLDRTTALALGVIVLVGAVLRAGYLTQPLRVDEARTFLSFAQMPVHHVPVCYNQPNNHILNTLLIKLSTGVFGESEWAIRLPAALFGTLALPLAFFFFRALYGRGAGLLTAAAMAASSPLIEYSANGRGYTLVLVCFLGMLSCGRYALRRSSTAGWVACGLCGLIGASAVPVMALPAAVTFLWLLQGALAEGEPAARRRKVLSLGATAVGLLLATLAFYAPAMAVNGPDVMVSNEGVPDTTPGQAFARAPGFLAGLLGTWHRDLPTPADLVLGACALTEVIFHRRLARAPGHLHFAALAVIVLHLVLISGLRYHRVWLFLLPVYLGLAGAGMHALIARWVGGAHSERVVARAAVLLVVAAGLAVRLRDSVPGSPETGIFVAAPEAVEHLEREARRGDWISVYGTNSAPLRYYARRSGIELDIVGDWGNTRIFRVASGMERPREAPAAVFFVVNTGEVGRYKPVEYLSAHLPEFVRLRGGSEALVRGDDLELWTSLCDASE